MVYAVAAFALAGGRRGITSITSPRVRGSNANQAIVATLLPSNRRSSKRPNRRGVAGLLAAEAEGSMARNREPFELDNFGQAREAPISTRFARQFDQARSAPVRDGCAVVQDISMTCPRPVRNAQRTVQCGSSRATASR